MFICICQNITDKTIKHSIDEGSTTLRSLCRCLNVGSGCGQCMKNTKKLLDSQLIAINNVATSK